MGGYTVKIKLSQEEVQKILVNHLLVEGQIDQRIIDECTVSLGKEGRKYTVEITTPEIANDVKI